MNRRQSLRLIGATAAAIPFTASALEMVGTDRIVFLGKDGHLVRDELLHHMPDLEKRFNEHTPRNLYPTLFGEATIVVMGMSDPEITEDLQIIRDKRGPSDLFHTYTITRYHPDGHSMEKLEEWSRLWRHQSDIVEAFADNIRSFTSLDFTLNALKPQWPVKWVNRDLPLEHKQIVWELMRRV